MAVGLVGLRAGLGAADSDPVSDVTVDLLFSCLLLIFPILGHGDCFERLIPLHGRMIPTLFGNGGLCSCVLV